MNPGNSTPSRIDRAMARVSENCVVCNYARRRQSGLIYWLVKRVETHICPFCRAYHKVFGRKSHEPKPPALHETR